MSQEFPYPEVEDYDIEEHVLNGGRPKPSPDWPPNIVKAITLGFAQPNDRPTAEQQLMLLRGEFPEEKVNKPGRI